MDIFNSHLSIYKRDYIGETSAENGYLLRGNVFGKLAASLPVAGRCLAESTQQLVSGADASVWLVYIWNWIYATILPVRYNIIFVLKHQNTSLIKTQKLRAFLYIATFTFAVWAMKQAVDSQAI